MISYKMLSYCCLVFLLFSCKNEPKEATPEVENQKSEKEVEVSTVEESKEESQYTLDSDSSVINWTGFKPAGKHYGKIKIKSGEINFVEGKLSSSKFVIDMNSITVLDLEGDEKQDLENHLKGNIEGKEDHFFNVKKYPEAVFNIKSVTDKNNASIIYGELTIKGISNPIEFKSNISLTEDKEYLKMTSQEFEIDRTKWGIEYMSKSVFDDLKERFIYDEIGLEIMIKATKI